MFITSVTKGLFTNIEMTLREKDFELENHTLGNGNAYSQCQTKSPI